MASRNTRNRICPVCGRRSHRGTTAIQSLTNRGHRLVRPGRKAKPPTDSSQASTLDSKTTADNA